jgi:ubiquinone/menaquinone biosynthesis C-methylase UbiE
MLSLMENSVDDVWNKFLQMLEVGPEEVVLDLGCGAGEFTTRVASKIGTKNIFGVDLNLQELKLASSKGIQTYSCNLNERLPFKNEMFDVVVSQQVIEHLYDVDSVVKEIHRVLKPTGYAVISTENLSSWHNLFSLFLGYDAFSCCTSTELHIGNPLSPHYGEKIDWPLVHVKIMTCQSLKELLEIHGFKVQQIVGAGYYPFPKRVSSIFSSIDPRHAHFITAKARKISQIRTVNLPTLRPEILVQ